MEEKRRAVVYIDGLNLYYNLVKDTPYKWLDFVALFRKVLPKSLDILKIKYFTTIVKGFPNDPQAPFRQNTYIRALKEVSGNMLEVYYGSFEINSKKRRLKTPLIDSQGQKIYKVWVIEPEEKGSDVNLAVHLLNDSWKDYMDWAVVVSNDSDLAESLRLARMECGKKILLVPPISPEKNPSSKLLQYADKHILIREAHLKESQLPDVIPGTNIRKPKNW
jgi:uncharacterized LabA/DUF88 family protein